MNSKKILEQKISFIKKNQSIALLAPSFPIDFQFPNIIGQLRDLGFDKVTELTFGARMVNWYYAQYVKTHPKQKYFITSPCPSIDLYISSNYPDLKRYLIPIASPMLATARIYKKHHPEAKIIFFSPCYAKQKIEAPKYKNDIDLVVTFRELKEILENEKIKSEDFLREYFFDSLIREYTKIYPVSGGLAETSHIQKLFKPSEIIITDEVLNVKKLLDEITTQKSPYRFFDILNCKGGCIGGPAINNQNLSTDEKKELVLAYKNKSSRHSLGKHEGKIENAEDVNMLIEY